MIHLSGLTNWQFTLENKPSHSNKQRPMIHLNEELRLVIWPGFRTHGFLQELQTPHRPLPSAWRSALRGPDGISSEKQLKPSNGVEQAQVD